MQVQQLTDLNVSGARQVEANKTAKSSVVEAGENQQENAFKDQLNKQIDHSKARADKENKLKNQENSIDKESESVSSEESELARDAQPARAADTSEKGADNQAALEEVTETEDSVSETPIPSDVLPVGIQEVEELPENGNPLPLSTVPEKAIAATAQVISSAQDAEKHVTESVEQKKGTNIFARVTQTIEKPVDVVAASAKSQTQHKGEAAASPAVYKAVNPAERMTTTAQGVKLAPVMSEMPVAEAVTQSTRLQQVALATAISASTPTAQNINAVALSPVTETNPLLPGTNPISNSLSSTITAQVQSPQWSQKMTEQVSFMLKGGFQQAQIKLNPAHLGPMEIKLALNDDQASVTFVAQHAPVREALDSAIPRLREMLEQQGINLADVDVSSKSQQQAEGGSEDNTQGAGLSGDDPELSEDATETSKIVADLEVDSGVSIYA